MDQKQFTQDCSRHVLPQKFDLCCPCRAKTNLVNPSQQWTRTKRIISFARGSLNLDASDEHYIKGKDNPKKICRGMCGHVLLQIFIFAVEWSSMPGASNCDN